MIFLKAVLLATVQGITEFLPISSTGHMILVDQFLKLSDSQAFTDSFIVIVQLPAILSVVVFFWKDLWPFTHDSNETKNRFVLWTKIVAAFLPAAVTGALFNDWISDRLYNPITVALALLVGGILLIVLERRQASNRVPTVQVMTFGTAIAIGAIQCIAMVPGTSRSAATIIGAMALGASRMAAAEFSFFLAIPTMVGATAFTVLKSGLAFTGEQWLVLAVGSIVSFVVSYAVVAILMNYIRRHDFRPFAYYRIVLAGVVLAYFVLFR